jgi:hypothetical protein
MTGRPENTSIPQKRRTHMARGQFIFSDDTVQQQALVDPPDEVCQAISGAGAAANMTDMPVLFYGKAGCGGNPIFVMLPRTIVPVIPFESLKFSRSL